MAAPTVRAASQTTHASSQTSVALPVPAGAAVDDVAVVCLRIAGTVAAGLAVTPPAGFTLKEDYHATGAQNVLFKLYWKRLTTAETGTWSFTWSTAYSATSGAVLVIGAATSGDPFDVYAEVGQPTITAGGSTAAISVTTTVADTLLFWVFFIATTNGNITVPAGFTQHVRQTVAAGSALNMSTKPQTAAGGSGTVTGTSGTATSLQGGVALFALQPAAGGGPTAHPLAGMVASTSTTAGTIEKVAGAVAHPLAGTVAATSATSGTPAAVHPLAGLVAGVSTTSGTVTATHPLAGTAAAVTATSGTINLVGGPQAYPLAGMVAATSTLAGTPQLRATLGATSSAITTTTGTITTGTTGYPKTWTGSTWVKKPGKVWTGTAQAPAPFKTWTGSTWKTLT